MDDEKSEFSTSRNKTIYDSRVRLRIAHSSKSLPLPSVFVSFGERTYRNVIYMILRHRCVSSFSCNIFDSPSCSFGKNKRYQSLLMCKNKPLQESIYSILLFLNFSKKTLTIYYGEIAQVVL